MSIKSVEYLCKHINKGCDCVKVELQVRIDHDEINTFLDARYLSAPEAAWKLFEFPMSYYHRISYSLT